ncbi:DUF6624 domain-containing protein [Streptomyces amakusaensis]|uniref:DUF6624 domain-containing protein n=1 Tax=Streptomyces amakusaensis TaxID=67271 RepID=A0ABW0AK82_9ACTN
MGSEPGAALAEPVLAPDQAAVLAMTGWGVAHEDMARAHDWTPAQVTNLVEEAVWALGAQSPAEAVHIAYERGIVPRPTRRLDTGGWSPLDLRIWQALTVHPDVSRIAKALGRGEAAVAETIDSLLGRTGARTPAHLVTCGHALGILGRPDLHDPDTDLATPTHPDLARDLVQRATSAQPGWTALLTDEMSATQRAALRETDRVNTAWLLGVVDRHGWPGDHLVGRTGSRAAWLLALHAPSTREQCFLLTAMAVAAGHGQADRAQWARLYDQVCVATGQPQLFMTYPAPDHARHLTPVPELLNARRAAAGLPLEPSFPSAYAHPDAEVMVR